MVLPLQKQTRHLTGSSLKRGVLTELEKAGLNDIWTVPVSIGIRISAFDCFQLLTKIQEPLLVLSICFWILVPLT